LVFVLLFYPIDFDRFICFYLPVSVLAIRLPCFNKLELSWEIWDRICLLPDSGVD